MWSKLEELLNGTGIEYARQGSYSEDGEYPERFFTFWNYDSEKMEHYDNESYATVWRWEVCYYTRYPSELYDTVDDLIAEAKNLGFVIEDSGFDVPSGRADMFGRKTILKYIEQH